MAAVRSGFDVYAMYSKGWIATLPPPVVAIGVLDEGVRHEHVPKPLTYARHPAQQIGGLDSGQHVAEQDDLAIGRSGTEPGIVIGKGVLDLLELEEPRVREREVAAGTDDLPGTVSQHCLVHGNTQKLVDVRSQIFGNRT